MTRRAGSDCSIFHTLKLLQTQYGKWCLGSEPVDGGVYMGDPLRPWQRQPRRIVHVFEMGLIGGQFRVVESLAAAQSSVGLDPSVVVVLASVSSRHHPMLDSMADAGVRVVRIPLSGGRAYFTERREVVARARALSADVVHTHGYRADVVDAPATHWAGFVTVCTLHGFTGGGLRNRLYERLQRMRARSLDGVVAVSTSLRDQLLREGLPAERLHIVRNGWCSTAPLLERVTARARLGASDAFTIGWVGRVSHEKGPDVLIDALRLLGNEDVEAVVIGDGPARRELADQARMLPVRWAGVLHRADTLFPAFDVFVLSSRTEGTPMVLLEAIQAEVPIIATRVGGVPDIVGPDEALLVPSEDAAALASAILCVRDDPESARRRAVAARRKVAEDLGPERWVEAYQRVYAAAIAFHRSHAR